MLDHKVTTKLLCYAFIATHILSPPVSSSLGTTNLLSYHYSFAILRMLYNTYTVFILWGSAFASSAKFPQDSSKLSPCVSGTLLCFAELYSTVWMYYKLFNQSPTERHLGSFQFGAIINSHYEYLYASSCKFRTVERFVVFPYYPLWALQVAQW